MPILVFDQSTIEKLKAVAVVAEVRDERGELIGYFHAVAQPRDARSVRMSGERK